MTAVSRQPKGEKRRAKIVKAAIAVIAEQGVEVLSHRRVAAAAGVPLAATTYYFKSLDELRGAALSEIIARDLAAMDDRFQNLEPTGDLGEILAELVWEWLENREASMVTVEIFASAMRRETVREIAQAWEGAWIEALTPRVGRTRALTSVCAAVGYIQHSLLQEDQPGFDEVAAVMRQALGETNAIAKSTTAPATD